MRDRMERFVVLPFSAGCISSSSIAVAAAALSPSPRRSKPDFDSSPQEDLEDDEENMKNAFKFHALSKPEMPTSIHRLFKSFKTISHIFAYKEEMEEYEEASGMEIGFPTDVKHVSHIGWESPIMTTAAKSGEGFEHLIPPELLPHHHHHHLAMLPATAQQDRHLHSALLSPST